MYTPHVSVLISSGGVCMHPPTFRQLVEAYSSAHMEHKKLHLPSTISKGPWSNTIGPKIGVWNPLLWGWPLTKINIFWVWILEFRLCILGFHWKTCNWNLQVKTLKLNYVTSNDPHHGSSRHANPTYLISGISRGLVVSCPAPVTSVWGSKPQTCQWDDLNIFGQQTCQNMSIIHMAEVFE